MYGRYIDFLFGSYTGFLSFFPLQYFLHRYHSRIYNKNPNSSNASKLILRINLLNKTSVEIEYYELFRTHVNKIKINKINKNLEKNLLCFRLKYFLSRKKLQQ